MAGEKVKAGKEKLKEKTGKEKELKQETKKEEPKEAKGTGKETRKEEKIKESQKKEEKPEKKSLKKLSKEELDRRRMELTGELRVFEVIEYPLITEKAVNMIEAENKLSFIVNKKARKQDVRKAVELLYDVRVDGVNILKDMKSRKRAIVKINKAFKAEDIATQLGVL